MDFTGKCLILNGYSRNSLAIIRSLGAKHFKCDMVSYDTGNNKLNDYYFKHKSKHLDKVILVKKDLPLHEQLIDILKKENYDFLFAGGTDWSNLIAKYKSNLSTYVKVVSEDYEKIKKVHDKHSSLELISKLNIKHPKSFIAKNHHDLEKIANELDGKAIVKMTDSYASMGLSTYEGTINEFINDYIITYGFDYQKGNFPIIQQLLKGDLYDTTAFSINGESKAILSQQRIVTAWLKGGGGVVNTTVLKNEIIENTKLILKELKWNGHIEIDWFYNHADKSFYFIEINPKFWGTTQLTISAGYDFPYWSTLLYSNQPIPEIKNFKTGLTYRWLEEELYAIFKHSTGTKELLKEINNFIKRFFKKNTVTSFCKNDLAPFKGYIKETIWAILKLKFGRR